MLRPPSIPAKHKRGPTAPGHQWRRRPADPAPGHPGAGFTLLEVIVVLVILGILAAVAVNRTSNDDTEIQTRTATLKSHLRYAQLRALNSGVFENPVIWGIKSDGGNYWLFRYENAGDEDIAIRLPGEEDTEVAAGVLSLNTWLVAFDYYGRPLSDPADPAGSLLTANQTISTGAAQPITITRNTGLIP